MCEELNTLGFHGLEASIKDDAWDEVLETYIEPAAGYSEFSGSRGGLPSWRGECNVLCLV